MRHEVVVEKKREEEFEVTVREGSSATTHRVNLRVADWQRLCDGRVIPEELVRRSFEFLLEREPKEAILRQFDLSLIAKYFPEYPREIRVRLGGSEQQSH